MKIIHFEKASPLDKSLKDFLITSVDIEENTKKLISFCVLQVYYKGEEVHEIIRFDSAHGKFHVHKFFKIPMRKEGLNEEISTKSFYKCRKNIKQNWKKYRKLYDKKLMQEKQQNIY